MSQLLTCYIQPKITKGIRINMMIVKKQRKRKVLVISAVLIALGSVAITQGDKVKHAYISFTQSEYQPEVTESKEYDNSTFQSLVEGPGVVLTEDSIKTILGPATEKSIDAVTAATPYPARTSDSDS